MKKFFTILIVIAIATLFYTEKTGKTNLQGMFSQYVLGIDPEEGSEDGSSKYQLTKPAEQKKWDAADEAIKDAGEYHREAKNFARKTNDAVNQINDAAK